MTIDIDVEERAAQAEAYFRSGYNCAQAIYMTFADLYGLDPKMASIISAPLGGGMGRLREVCGACSGMFLVAGLQFPADEPSKKGDSYKLVQELAEEFQAENGSIICRELLGLDYKKDCPIAEARTETYYKKRPCAKIVYKAAIIVGKKIQTLNKLNEN
ncbi:MAG TPA: C-GCAxxG-C-C family protein [Paludibacteraceae bacterium]|jgi:C_GCAxxG_C_C family probable redox protein|nr:C-GCAxxG-C-C family protein [Paludibacteraceae bacterium]HQB69118.1 C-GCAxxG-C-C family protein [Paludibacteraceae bacterium]HRS68116.1 C-GCAxxG-C-C family protein [Paludibacteraceae bacterium]